jgi:hypothetical protein
MSKIPSQINALVDRHAPASFRAGCRESHTFATLARRLGVSVAFARQAVSRKIFTPTNELCRGQVDGPLVYFADDLNAVRREILFCVAQKAIELGGDTNAAAHALNTHVKNSVELHYGREEEDPSILPKVGKAVAVVGTGAALAGGAAYARGRLAAGAARAGSLGLVKTGLLGGRLLKKDASAAGAGALDLLRRARAVSVAARGK